MEFPFMDPIAINPNETNETLSLIEQTETALAEGENRPDFHGRVAFVTGASRGIGAACGIRLALSAARVVFVDQDVEPGQALVESLRAKGCDATFMQCDVSDETQVVSTIAATIAQLGNISMLVNNAGSYFQPAPLAELSTQDWSMLLHLNLTSMFMVGREVGRHMLEKKPARAAIVNMSSINGMFVMKGQLPYCVSKSAIQPLTRCMAVELAPHVRVNAVAPGIVRTRQCGVTAPKTQYRVPLGRSGEPWEIASAVAFLLSSSSSFVTGEVLVVDGGEQLPR